MMKSQNQDIQSILVLGPYTKSAYTAAIAYRAAEIHIQFRKLVGAFFIYRRIQNIGPIFNLRTNPLDSKPQFVPLGHAKGNILTGYTMHVH